jgi:predicted dehydrogenase
MKLAFIGASHWHLPLYLDPALEIDGVKVVGVSDPDAACVTTLAARLGCAGDTDFRALCRKTRPDFVVALGRHCDMVDEATFLLEEGIAFALEKPCGLNARDAAALAAMEARTGHFAAVPLVFRNGDFAARLQEMSAKGAQYMTYRFIAGFPARYRAANCAWMLDPALAGGGSTINLGIHFFDLALLLMGPEVRVRQATMSNAAWGHPIEDYGLVVLERGADLCVIETGYLYPAPTSTFDMHYALRTPDQYLVAHDQETIELVQNSGERQMIATHTTNVAHYRTFMRDVLDRVRKRRPPLAKLSDMVPIMRLVDDAYAKAGPLPLPAAPSQGMR